jgi:hypothetical protein
MPIDRLLSPAQVAEALGLNVGDVGRLISAGTIPALRHIVRGTGKRPRLKVRESALIAYIDGLPDAVGPVQHAREPSPRKRAMPPDLVPTTKYY